MAGKYLPTAEGDLVVWLNNFIAKLTIHLATVGLVAGDLTAATNDSTAIIYLINCSAAIKTRTQDVNDYKKQLLYGPGPIGAFPASVTFAAAPTAVLANAVSRFSALVNRIKAAPGYTNAIGEDLGIVSSGPPAPDLDTVSPTFTATALPDSQVRLDWVKGVFDAVKITTRINGAGDLVFLATDTVSPYLDTRAPLTGGIPETRQYVMQYMLNDVPVGLESDKVDVSTIP